MTATERAATVENYDKGVKRVTWSGLDGDDTGAPVSLAGYADKSVQFGVGASNASGGIFGSSTNTLEGTNDPRGNPSHTDHANAQWNALKDPLGNSVSATSAKGFQILENFEWVRCKQTGGSAGDLAVVLIAVRQRGN